MLTRGHCLWMEMLLWPPCFVVSASRSRLLSQCQRCFLCCYKERFMTNEYENVRYTKWYMVHEKENELALQWADMRMIGKKLSCVELRQRLGIENTLKVVQINGLQWYGYVVKKKNDATDHRKQRKMIGGNWSDSSNDSDAENWIQIVHFRCRLTQINLD